MAATKQASSGGAPRVAPAPREALGSAYLLAFGSMVMLQGGNALGLVLIHHLGVPTSTSLRLLFGSIFLVVVLRPPRRLGSAERRLVLMYGFVVAAMGGLIYEAVDRLPLSVAVTVSLLGPLTVAATSSRRRRDLLWPLLALVGVILLAQASGGEGPSVDAIGLACAAGNAVAWGTYIVIAARAGRQFDGVHGLAWACVVAAILWFPAGVASGGYASLTVPVLLLAILTAVIATGLPYTMENLALRRMPQRIFGILMSFEPAVAMLAGLLLLGQQPGILALGGIALVIVASIGASMPGAPAPAPP